ncbi:MBL fold metallo-hydrolase [Bosea sp. UC22_33]|uniref:MBL fold metallo-hydrolase n=1 Tax=Bosea sp. UC22_33 TaxID=3350165 RepID=UPI00366FC237
MMFTRRTLLASGACSVAMPALAQVVATLGSGDEQISILSDGGFEMPLSTLARAVPVADISAQAGPSNPFRTPLNITCLRRGKDVILFDCGAGANFLPGSGRLQESLRTAGIEPEAVTHVLFTHLHPDHFWGALDEFDSPLFPNARWLAAAREIDFWTSAKVYDHLPADRHAFAAGAQRIAKNLGDRLERAEAGREWLPGIAAVETAGHTPGHVSFVLSVGGTSVMVLGDALTHPQISFAHPDWQPASDQDAELAAATRRRLLDELGRTGMQVIGYHLPGATGRVERQGTAYRFVGT